MRFLNYIYFLGLFSILILGCRKNKFEGDCNANKAPKTFMIADTIIRAGADRYNSQVKVHWWGTDEDGFISGYKISTDLVNWIYTTRQDSVFNLILPNGKDTFDFRFYIKAVDNLGKEDEKFASLAYPVKNSAPSISYITPTGTTGIITRNPIKSFPVVKYNWIATDPDGNQDLDHIEICLNDSTLTPYIIDAGISEITLFAENPSASNTSCKIYNGQSTTALAGVVQNMLTNQNNILYIRSVDKVGSKSSYIASNPIYIKKVNSSILLVNAITSPAARKTILNFYTTNLQSTIINSFDTMQVLDIVNNNYTELSVDNLTQSRIFSLFKHILWFTDDANFSLSFGQKTIGTFFKSGGTMFMSCAFSNNWDTTSSWLDFTPIKSLVSQPTGITYRMVDQAPITNTQAGWPVLNFYTVGAPIVRPIFKFDDNSSYSYQYLYRSTIKVTGGGPSYDWTSTDSTNIIAKRYIPGGNTNFIFSSLPFEKLSGNANIQTLFQKIFKDELGF